MSPPQATPGGGAVLLDLDGTLVDTLPDLAWALNRVLAQSGRPTRSAARLRPRVTRGARAMLESALEAPTSEAEVLELTRAFLAVYADNIARLSRLFPGMDAVLAHIESSGRRWGVVTNKASRYTDPLLEQLGLARRAACVVSGDTTMHSKPHPGPLLHAALAAGSVPHDCVYVGDAAGDVEAARHAGMPVAVALWGYIDAGDDPDAWDADAALAAPSDLLGWLREPR